MARLQLSGQMSDLGVGDQGSLLLRNAVTIDPATGTRRVDNLAVIDGRIAHLPDDQISDTIIDATGYLALPGFIDIHCHLRDPGFEYKETILSGTTAAARGGYTTICCMPDTDPPIDTGPSVEYVLRAAADAPARVLPLGAVTRGRAGEQLAELADLAQAGCVAFSDDGMPMVDAHLLRRALEYASMLKLALIDHCHEPSLSHLAVMHEGWVSTRLGLRGAPSAAEEALVARDIALARETDSHIHFAHVSTAESVEWIRHAKSRGVNVTAEVTPHHLTLTHEAVMMGATGKSLTLAYDTNAKVNPPLRTQQDVEACLSGLIDGTIDCIATDHAPHAFEEKYCEFDTAAFGISGLETAFGLCMTLVHQNRLPLETLIERMTLGAVRALALDRGVPLLGTLREGAPGDIVLIDPDAEWRVDSSQFASKGKNTPLEGMTLRGKVVMTISRGRIVHDGRET
jgi:dihydroorotase